MEDIVAWILATILAVGGFLGAIWAILEAPGKTIGLIRSRVGRKAQASLEDDARPEDVPELVWATKMLARTTRDQWQREAIRLGLIPRESAPGATGPAASLIQIGWSIDERVPILPGGQTSDPFAAWRDEPGVDQLADFFHDSPSKAMVLLGSPQAGKSAAAVLLTLGLLAKRTADADPVPVKFSLANWDHDVSLEDWLTQRLEDDHTGFQNTERYGAKVVERLLRSGLVLPILDGLDELPGGNGVAGEDERDRVIKEINASDLQLPGLILTCQQEVYDELAGRVHDAVIVKLAGVPIGEAYRYIWNASLRTSHPERWEPVLNSLKTDADSSLAAALASPLMVYLVPKVYEAPTSTPAELLAPAFLGRPDSIERHLLRAFVPAVFSDRPGRRPWRSKDAVRWLGHLAAKLEDTDRHSRLSATRFGWWDLSWFGRPETAVMAGVVGGVVGGGAVLLAFLALFNPVAAIIAGGIAAITLGYLCGRNPPPRPSETQRRTDVRFSSVLKSGLAIGLIVLIGGALSRDISLGIIAGLGFGVPIAILYGLTEPDPTLRPLDAGLLLRRDIKVGITFGLTYGVPAGITAWFLTAHPLLSVLVGIAAGLAGALLYGPVWIFAALAPMGGARQRLESIGVVAFVHLAIATLRFAPAGKLPWRVMAFLDRAHDLGVLRLVSGSYEFRHQALQQVLAAEYRGSPLPPARAEPAEPAEPAERPAPKKRRRPAAATRAR